MMQKDLDQLYRIFCEQQIVTTDSRDCPQGSIFFALKGDTFNGNHYAQTALEKGCSYAVVDEDTGSADERIIMVEDVLATLQGLALLHRRTLGTKIIGITGTNGKTTTKELIATILGKRYNVLYTQGNFNNHIGVPKTLLRLTKEHDIAVVEMGANHPGEIRTLAEIAEPDYGLITNVGKAHLEGFGSFEGVIRTKGELYDWLRKSDGEAFINKNNVHLMGISHDLRLTPYGKEGKVLACDPYLRMIYEDDEIKTQLIGSYNLDNCLAAAAVGRKFGVTHSEICAALAEYTPSNNRSQLLKTATNTLIVDAYNANPTSMMAALMNFRDTYIDRKMAILGDMRELGSVSQQEHQKVVDFLKEQSDVTVWLVGEEFGRTECTFRKFHNVEEVQETIATEKPQGYCILIKGSNSMKLWKLAEINRL